MRSFIYVLFMFLFVFAANQDGYAKRKKENKKIKEECLTPYQKFFKDRKVTTKEGFMKLHYTKGQVYVEFPVRLLHKEMMLTSSIEDISDNGEGVVGQFAGGMLLVKFVRMDSTLQARFCVSRKPLNHTGSVEISEAIDKSYAGGVYKLFRIEAFTPDSTAILVNMTSLFLEQTYYTNPFPDFAGNSIFGLVTREHKFKEERSFVKGANVFDDNIVVQCQMGFNVDYLLFGAFLMRQNVPVSVTSNRILLLLPEDVMTPRLADSRVGVRFVPRSDFVHTNEGVKTTYYTRRWRIEPSDETIYQAGSLVEPKKQVVFYMDTIMPEYWKKYVKEGAEEWNKTFEKIGFKNVVRVQEFPKNDSLFDANNINYSTIRYAPLNMFFVQMSMHTDPRSGEILNASVYLPNNFINPLYFDRVAATMVSDPRVRRYEFDEKTMGESIKMTVTRAVGKCLGLDENFGASYMYPVDSLRSPGFTNKYGLSPTIMDVLTFNYVAQPEDVQKGVRLTSKGIGEYDYFTIKWLYQPLKGLVCRNESIELDKWIKDYPAYRFGKRQPYYSEFDPSSLYGDIGNDHVKTMRYLIQNMKVAIPNLFHWFRDQDEDMVLRQTLYEDQVYLFKTNMLNVMTYFGGIHVNEVEVGDQRKNFEIVPKVKQREALLYLLDVMKDLSWMDNKEIERQLEIADRPGENLRRFFFRNLFYRMDYVAMCADKSPDAYTPEEFVQDVYNEVWEATLANRPLTPMEMNLQIDFLGNIITTSCVMEAPSNFKLTKQIVGIVPDVSGSRLLNRNLDKQEVQNMISEFQHVSASWMLMGERAGFYPLEKITANRASFAPLYYSMLLKTQNILKNAVVKSTGDTRLHYEYLLYEIKQALEKE